MTNTTGTFTAEAAEPAPAPKSYVADRDEALREIARAVTSYGLAVPDDLTISRAYDQINMVFDSSADTDAWAEYLNSWTQEPEFQIRSKVTDRFWHYGAKGTWLGRWTSLVTVHSFPVGAELVEQPAEVPA